MLIDFNYKFVGVDNTVYEDVIDGYSYLDASLKAVEQEHDKGNFICGDYSFTIATCNPGNGVSLTRYINIDKEGWVRYHQ